MTVELLHRAHIIVRKKTVEIAESVESGNQSKFVQLIKSLAASDGVQTMFLVQISVNTVCIL